MNKEAFENAKKLMGCYFHQGNKAHSAPMNELKSICERLTGQMWTNGEFYDLMRQIGCRVYVNVNVEPSPLIAQRLWGAGDGRIKKFFSTADEARENEIVEQRQRYIEYLNEL